MTDCIGRVIHLQASRRRGGCSPYGCGGSRTSGQEWSSLGLEVRRIDGSGMSSDPTIGWQNDGLPQLGALISRKVPPTKTEKASLDSLILIILTFYRYLGDAEKARGDERGKCRIRF